MKIRQAYPHEAPLIAQVVTMAIGHEIIAEFAAPDHTADDVQRMFEALASMPDSQYSYLNTSVAADDDDTPMGLIVAYDGAQLHKLRERFMAMAATMLGKDMRGMADETTPDEFYLDSLGVFEQYRGRGIASALLMHGVKLANALGKPAALLVEPTNENAYRLYRKLGFVKIGETPFADTMMDHLRFV